MSDAERLDRLEREIAILRAEFARLREHVGAPASTPPRSWYKAPPPPPAAESRAADARASAPTPPPRVEPTREPGRSFEEIIGSAGMTAVALVMVLIGLSTFLGWAIQRGLLGPTTRVVLGYAAAGGIAFAGMRFRMRGTREFGNVLLAIALAVVHLVCWSAGPLLHVIPSWVALAIGFFASVALAEFALRHDEQALCAVGFGGAALAPFIAGDSGGSRVALTLYGVFVVGLGSAALGSRKWTVARAVVMWSIILYTAVSGTGLPVLSPPQWIAIRLWVIAPLLMLLVVIPAAHPDHRRPLIRVSAAALVLGALLRADWYAGDAWVLALTLLGTIVVIGALDVTRGGALEREAPVAALDRKLIDRDALLDAFLIPVGLFIATVAATPDVVSFQSAAVAMFFTLLAIWMTHRARGEPEGGGYASTASLIALWIVPAAFFDQHLARAAGTAAMGIVLMVIALRMNRGPFVAGAFGAFTLSSIWALFDADARPRFEYLPFGTVESLGVTIAVLAWIAGVRVMANAHFLPELELRLRGTIREAFITGAAVTGFFWGVAELQGAWSATAATALLIV
ncbi:MAG TPA: DUF2339 domain-containing protein, partial [Gemmatimonadaceae bacterium]|nr:DUF2339 domain-containing protein [Gemmatimonadaceae bacterium]